MDLDVTPPAERDGDLVGEVVVGVRQVMGLEERSAIVGMRVRSRLQAAPVTRPFVRPRSKVGTFPPRPLLTPHRAPKVLIAAGSGERRIAFRSFDGKPTAPVVGAVVTPIHVRVGIIDPDGRAGRRVLHRAMGGTRLGNTAAVRGGSERKDIAFCAVFGRGGMEVVHVGGAGEAVLADDVSVADGPTVKMLGRMGRPPLEPGQAMAFRFREPAPRRVHTFFVRGGLDVIWIVRERVTATATLSPWRLGSRHRADTIVELPAGTADNVSVDDRIRLDRT